MTPDEVEAILSDLRKAAEMMQFLRGELAKFDPKYKPRHGHGVNLVSLRKRIARGMALAESLVLGALKRAHPLD